MFILIISGYSKISYFAYKKNKRMQTQANQVTLPIKKLV